MRNMVRLTAIALLLLAAAPVGGSSGELFAATLLNYVFHPRVAALGGAAAALSGAPEALWWNPANLAGTGRAGNLFYTYIPMPVNITLHQASLALSPGRGRYGTVALSTRRLDYGLLQMTALADNDSGYVVLSTFRLYEQTAGLAYGATLKDRLSVGGHIKYAWRSLYSGGSSIISSDWGVSFRTGFNDLRLGLALRNVAIKGPRFREGSKCNDPLSPLGIAILDIGAAMNVLQLAPAILDRHRLLVAAGVGKRRDYSSRFKLGAEYSFRQILFLRTGYKWRMDVEGLNLGAGLRLPVGAVSIQLDYAWQDYSWWGSLHRFALQLAY